MKNAMIEMRIGKLRKGISDAKCDINNLNFGKVVDTLKIMDNVLTHLEKEFNDVE